MKVMKKIAAVLLAVSLAVPFVGVQAEAADGTLMFSDPQTKVGEQVSVDLVVQSGGATIGDVDVTMKYDTTALEFVSGNEVTSDGQGNLTYSHKGTGSETELRTTMEFRALKQGEANITVSGHTAYLYSDEALSLSEGSSVVTIDVGADGSTSVEPSTSTNTNTTASATDVKVNVNGEEYSFSEDFTAVMIPEGYSETKMTYSGAERKFVANENGVKLGYLVGAAGKGNFFLYNEDNATFSPFVEMGVSETTSIILLTDVDAVSLPENYQKADLQVGDYTFPAWQDMEHEGYYAMYALNTTTGKKGLYQYDTVDGTYQRLILQDNTEKETEKDDDSFLGKVKNLIYNHFMVFLIICAVIVLAVIILIIVISVKLYHRNAELDDLYDEYDILDDEEEEEPTSKKSKKQFAGFRKNDYDEDDDFLEDDYDGTFEDDADFDDYDDDYDYDEDDEFAADDYDEFGDDFEVGYDEDDLDDFEDEVPVSKKTQKKSENKQKRAEKKSDPYEIDFIDL